MKTCIKCKTPKDESEFYFRNKTKGTRMGTCKECKREYIKSHYQKNKKYYIDKARKGSDRIREFFTEYKKTLSCKNCGDDRWYVLQFHHKDPTEKDFEVSKAVSKGMNKQKILREIEKCDVLCANCHMELHHFEKQ